MTVITNRTNGLYDSAFEFKDMVGLTNGVDENVFVDVSGTTYNLGIAPPDASATTFTPSGTGGATTGTIQFAVVFLNARLGQSFRSNPSPIRTFVISGSPIPNQVTLANVPVSADPQVTSREFYWSDPDGTTLKYGDIINDNTTTTSLITTNTNTGPLLDYHKAVFPICKYGLTYGNMTILANQTQNIVVPSRRSSTSWTVDSSTGPTMFIDAALASHPSNAINVWLGYRVEWLTGDNAGEIRTISAYNYSTGQVNFSVALPNTPTAGDTYRIHGTLNKSTIFYSDMFGYEGYNDGSDGEGVISYEVFDEGDGQEITGLAGFSIEKGDSSLGTLVIFKHRKIFFMRGFPTSWVKNLISDTVGCIAHKSIQEHEQVLYFLSNRMIYRLQQSGQLDPIGTPIIPTLDNINWSLADVSISCIYKDMYLLAVPWGTSTYANKILVYCIRYGTWHLWDLGGLNITAMNRSFLSDGTELLEMALWDSTNSYGEVVSFDAEIDGTAGTIYTVATVTPVGSPAVYTLTLTGTPSLTADGGSPWAAGTLTNRSFFQLTGTGAYQEGIVTATSDVDEIKVSGLTTAPVAGDTFTTGLVVSHFETGDIPVGQNSFAKGRTYDIYVGLRGSEDGEQIRVIQYEGMKTTSVHDTVYQIGSSLTAMDDPDYVHCTADQRSQHARFKVISQYPGQDFNFRSVQISFRPKPKDR